MIDQNFSGKWTGEYIYGEGYPATIRGKRVAFEIELLLRNGVVQGFCTDEIATPYFNQPAVIEGSISHNCITFIKRYPHYWWLEEYRGPRFFPKLPSQEVLYTGCYCEGRFEGEWEIITVLQDERGDTLAFKEAGHWNMKKL